MFVRLSKFISYILRHNPRKFGLKMDRNGFVELSRLVEVVSKKFPGVTKQMVLELVNSSPKKRFELVGDKIRATYGHTVDVDLGLSEIQPPDVLFHGTSRKVLRSVLSLGLLPMRRQYVHLSTTFEEAYKVGLRKDKHPVVLKINAKAAYEHGVKFYKSYDVWLVKYVPKDFIEVI